MFAGRSSSPRGFARVFLAAMYAAGSMLGCGDSTPTDTPNDAGPTTNGCTAAMFVDRTAPAAARTVGFGGAEGSGPFTYSPRCMTVAAGQTVTFTAGSTSTFGVHPLSPGTADAMGTQVDGGSPNTPIPRVTDGNMRMVTVTFPTAGTYPYFCEFHAPGMAGVIQVR